MTMGKLRASLFLLLLDSLGFLTVGAELLNNEITKERLSDAESVDLVMSQRFLTQLQTVLKEMDSKLSKHQQSIDQLQTENRELVTKLAQNEVKIEQLQMENQEQAMKLVQNDVQIQELQRLNQVRQVAFSAGLLASGEGFTGPYETDTKLVFSHVISNIGNAYNPNTGVFTAPVRGAYHFDIHILGGGSPGTVVGLVKNGHHIFISQESQSDGWGTAGNGASLSLQAGDEVYLRLWDTYRIYDNGNHHSTFSGRLLFLM